ncbi:MAG: nucleoside monophosphate kinase [Patescibacteria group bacterium]
MNSKAFIFFGRSGCGKGTQVKLLLDFLKSQNKEVVLIETGSTFRELSSSESYAGKLIGDILKTGRLIPIFLPIWIWTENLVKKYTGTEDLIFDGICRRYEESVSIDSAFDFYNIEKPNIILMNVSKEWSFTRMMERKRADDTPEKIQNRLDWFEKDVTPAINFFKNKDRYNFIEINGEQTVEEVHKEIINKLASSF